MPRLTIVIVTHNSAGEIGDCLASLTTNRATIDHEVVVVDNASRDGSAALVRRLQPGLRVIETTRNIGFAAANNLAIRESSGEFVLLLNPDTVVTAGAIDRLVGQLGARSDAAIAGPRLVDAEGRAERSHGPMIGPLAELRQKALVKGHARHLPVISGYVERRARRTGEVDWVSGACLLVRRVDAEAVDLLDERYFMYLEDVDFCAAVRARGRKVLFVADAEVRHLRGRSGAPVPRATMAAYRRSHLAFYAKHHPHLLPFLRAYLKVRGLMPDTL